MSRYDSDYTESNKKTKHKAPKFRDYYDDDLNEQEEKEFHLKRKQLDKKSKRKKNPDHEWPED